VKEEAVHAATFQGRREIPPTIGITPAPRERGFPYHIESASKKRAGICEQASGKSEYIVWPHGIHARFHAVPEDFGSEAQSPQIFLVKGLVQFLIGNGRGAQIHVKDPAAITFS
jgi:hypothetical protein